GARPVRSDGRQTLENGCAPEACGQTGKVECEKATPETAPAHKEPGSGGRVMRYFGGIQWGENVVEKQPRQESCCSRAAQPHVAVTQHGKKISYLHRLAMDPGTI